MGFCKFIFIYELTKTHNDINQYFYTITNIG